MRGKIKYAKDIDMCGKKNIIRFILNIIISIKEIT